VTEVVAEKNSEKDFAGRSGLGVVSIHPFIKTSLGSRVANLGIIRGFMGC
jgi:hypothetical protein